MNQNYLDVTIRIHVLTLLKWVKKINLAATIVTHSQL